MKKYHAFRNISVPSLVAACLGGSLATGEAQSLPENITDPIRARCTSPADPNPDVKYFYKIDGEYSLVFYAVLPGNAKFQLMRLPLYDPNVPEEYSLLQVDFWGNPLTLEEGATGGFYWAQTDISDGPIMWELRLCGNISHSVYDQVASLNNSTNELTVSQTRIEWIYNSCSGEFQTEAPVVRTITGVFQCEIITE